MASKRVVYPTMWADSFVGRLSWLHRLLWIGMITIADDQGRMEDDALELAARLFPYDRNVKESDIEDGLNQFAESKKIVRYAANGKNLIQIVQWWKNQSPPFAMASKNPAPYKWTDRARYHAAGNSITKKNWDHPGGFDEGFWPDGYIAATTGLRSVLSSDNVGDREEKRREEKIREEKEREESNDDDENKPTIAKLYEENIGPLTPIIADELRDMVETYEDSWIRKAIEIAATRNARNIRYILAILEDWKANGVGGHKAKAIGRGTQPDALDALIGDE